MTGFIIFDYLDRYQEGIDALSELLTSGKMTAREQIEIGGVTAFGSTLNLLFDGANTGKLVLEVGERTHDSEL